MPIITYLQLCPGILFSIEYFLCLNTSHKVSSVLMWCSCLLCLGTGNLHVRVCVCEYMCVNVQASLPQAYAS